MATQREIAPGDWIFEPGDRGDPSVGLGPVPPSIMVCTEQGDCVTICALEEPCYRDNNRTPTDEFDECVTYLGDLGANGNLIATAPKLLALAREIANDGHCSCDDWITTPAGQKCRVCRAKALVNMAATGESTP